MATVTDQITKNSDICGGEACIRGHRIPVWVLVNYRRLGGSAADILHAYPTLTGDDLNNAWEYAAAHAEEIDHAIQENEGGAENWTE